jgi:hypothetical protein
VRSTWANWLTERTLDPAGLTQPGVGGSLATERAWARMSYHLMAVKPIVWGDPDKWDLDSSDLIFLNPIG